MLDFRLGEVTSWIKDKGARKVSIQMPEGLKGHAQRIGDEIMDRTGASVLIIADPCYGACDVPQTFKQYSDVLIQFGHAEIPSLASNPDVLFIEIYLDNDITPLLPQLLPHLKHRVGLITTVQHIHSLHAVREWLERNGRKVFLSMGDNRTKFPGQVLGCNISAVKPIEEQVDQFLFIGSGDFHPLAVAIDSQKQVVVLDPTLMEIRELDQLRDRILRQRHGAITRAETAKKFLILVSSKAGQMRLDLAYSLMKLIQERGMRAHIVTMEDFNPDFLIPFEADAFVSTACPRIAIDDYLRYPRPILTPIELEIVLGLRKWADYKMDSIVGQPPQVLVKTTES